MPRCTCEHAANVHEMRALDDGYEVYPCLLCDCGDFDPELEGSR